MKNETDNPAPLSAVGTYEATVGIAIRRELLKYMDRIGEDVRARVKICCRCGIYFVARRRGNDIKWCGNCK